MNTGSNDRLLELRRLPTYQRIGDDDDNDSRWSANDDQTHRGQISTGEQSGIDVVKDGSVAPQQRKLGVALWKWEVASVWLSICLFVVLAVVLVQHNGQLQRQWNFPLSPNSLVAVFSTVIRIAILVPVAEVLGQLKWSWFRQERPLSHLEAFDNAGRTVWGSVRLLFLSRKPHILALLGALITVTSLAIGPMTQQAVRSELCSKFIPELGATVAVAEPIWVPDIMYQPKDSAEFYGLQLPIRSAMINSISDLAGTSSMTVPHVCPTGNCTFPSYQSLGFCSQCIDVKASVVETTCQGDEINQFCTNFSMPGTSPLNIEWDWGRGRLENGLSARPHVARNYSMTAVSLMAFTRARCTNFTLTADDELKSPYFRNSSDYLWRCPASAGLPSIPANTDILAVNCTVYPCLRTYQSKVANDLLQESVKSEKALTIVPFKDPTSPRNATAFTTPKFPCSVGVDVYDASNISTIPPSTPNLLQVNLDGQNVSMPQHCVYAATDFTIVNMLAFLTPLVTADCTTTFAMVRLDCFDSWWQEGLFNGGFATLESISGIFANVTTAMTNQFRIRGQSSARDGPGLVPGTSQEVGVCLCVEWPWLLFLTGLALSTAILLVCIMVSNRLDKSPVPVWKSSTVPYLFLGLDGALVGGATSELADMDLAVDRTKANLEPDVDDGWKLAAHNGGGEDSTVEQATSGNASLSDLALKVGKTSVMFGAPVVAGGLLGGG